MSKTIKLINLLLQPLFFTIKNSIMELHEKKKSRYKNNISLLRTDTKLSETMIRDGYVQNTFFSAQSIPNESHQLLINLLSQQNEKYFLLAHAPSIFPIKYETVILFTRD